LNKSDVIRSVAESEIEFIRVEHIDNNGIMRCRALKSRLLEKALERGVNMSTAIMSFNVLEHLIDNPMYGAKDGDYFLLPDPDTFTIIPYLTKTARMYCNLVDHEGKPWQGCTRTVLKNMVKQVGEMNLKFFCSFEVEGMLVKKTDDGYIPAEFSKCFNPDGLDAQEAILHKIADSLEKMNIEVDKMTAEYAPGQFEMNTQPAPPLKASDNFIAYKEAWRTIARQHGLTATFMPKPFEEYAGNGVHVHLSCFDETGKNLFEDKTDEKKLGISELCYHFIGGILSHAPALTALAAPTVNSYKRILPGTWSPAVICYGMGNRDVLIRIPDGPRVKRIEFRVGDGTCNPYLALAAVLAAGLRGIKEKINPGEPMWEEVGHFSPADIREKNLTWLPRSLEEAIAALKRDNYIISSLGLLLMEEYIKVRESELESFRKIVTEWELQTYLETY